MSVSGSSASRKRSWATIRFAEASLTSVPRKTIRARRSREKMSNERSKRPSDSTTIGTKWLNALLIGCTFIRNHTVARQGGTHGGRARDHDRGVAGGGLGGAGRARTA